MTTLELAKEKREVRLKMKKSNKMADKYKKLCNEVKASARKDKQEWLDRQCEKIEQSQEQQKAKEVYQLVRSVNKKWQPKQTAIKDKNGNTLMDKGKIKERWTEYCSELYRDTNTKNF